MEYTFENGVMIGLLLADSGAEVDNDEISKIKNGLLKYILQKGICQGTVKLAGNFSVKFYSGFLPRRNDPAAELFLNTCMGDEYINFTKKSNIINYLSEKNRKSIEIWNSYKKINLWSGEDIGLANKWLARIWIANVLFKEKTPLGAIFREQNSAMDMKYSYTFTYSDKDGKDGKISHIYLYPKQGYADITLTLPGDTLSGTAEYICSESGTMTYEVPGQGSSENFIASYKMVKYDIERPTYEVQKADGRIIKKIDYSAKPTIYVSSTTEYTEKFLSKSNDISIDMICPKDIQITDLSNAEIMDLEIEYINEILKSSNAEKRYPIYEVKKFLPFKVIEK